MLLTQKYISPEKKYAKDLSDIGVKRCLRKLIFFVDKTEFDLGIVKVGKAVQINISAAIGTNDFSRELGIVSGNSVSVKQSVYTYNCIFPMGMADLQAAQMVLEDAYSMDELNDFNERVDYHSDIGIYDQNVSTVEGKMTSLQLAGQAFRSSTVLPPQYYTDAHQTKEERECYSIIWQSCKLVYEGHELIDPYTTIEIQDLKSWDTMIPMLRQDIMMKSANINEHNGINFISSLFVPTTEAMMNNYIYIYDSLLGINVKPVNPGQPLELSEFRLKENLIAQLRFLKDLVEGEAKCIEAEKGNIRLYYIPNMTGDKLKVSFLDYNKDNQPDFNKSKIGKEYVIKEQAVREVNAANQILSEDYGLD